MARQGGVLQYRKIPNLKHQITNKFQIPSTKCQCNPYVQRSIPQTGLEFWFLVIVICDLEFVNQPLLQYSNLSRRSHASA
jgi:hypothetical protein